MSKSFVLTTQLDGMPENLCMLKRRLILPLEPFPRTIHTLDAYLTERFDQFDSVDGLMELFYGRA